MTAPRTAREARLRQGCVEIVDGLYASVADPTRWTAVVAAAARAFGDEASVIHRRDGGPIPRVEAEWALRIGSGQLS